MERGGTGSSSSSTVCVTGASGFIGSILVKKLLERGYTVHATVRNLGDDTKTGALKTLPGAEMRLKIFEADIYNSSSFESAIHGCQFVYHVATPLQHYANSTQFKDMSDAAVDAIQTILHRCETSGTVKRVIYTSSIVAASPLKEDGTGLSDYFDESCWTPLNASFPFPGDFEALYTRSKTVSEKALLNYNSHKNSTSFDIISLIIGLVGGSTILSHVPGSVAVIVSPLTGETAHFADIKMFQELMGSVPLVHVDDVCDALLICMEKPSMAGRFVCVAAYPSMEEYVEFFRNAHPDIAVIKEVEGDYPRVEGRSRKLVDAGFTYKYGLDEILEDSYRCAKKLGLLK